MRFTIHPAAFMFGSLLLCVVWLSIRTVPPPPFSAASQQAVTRPPRIEHKEIEVDPAALQRYTGEYRIADGTSIFIGVEGGRLFALVADTPRIALFPFSPNEFFTKELDAEVTFDASDDDYSARLTVRFPAGTISAKRADSKRR